jgi:hypothetical protein
LHLSTSSAAPSTSSLPVPDIEYLFDAHDLMKTRFALGLDQIGSRNLKLKDQSPQSLVSNTANAPTYLLRRPVGFAYGSSTPVL